MQKQHELTDPNSTLNRVRMDEPIFVLRAQDALAVPAIHRWIAEAVSFGLAKDKVQGARDAVTAFEQWQEAHQALVKLPD